MARDLSPLIPEKCNVVYPVRRCGGAPHDFFPLTYTSTTLLEDISFDNNDVTNAGQPVGVPNAILTLRDTAVALYNGPAGPAANQVALDDLAAQLFLDYCNYTSVSFDVVVSGIAAFVPTALSDIIEWNYTATDCWTRQQTAPWNGYPTEFQHNTAITTDCEKYDRYPAIQVDVPGGMPGTSMHANISIKDGRLIEEFDTSPLPFQDLPCGCEPPALPCGCICITVLSACGAFLEGLSITAAGTDFNITCYPSTIYIDSITLTAPGSGYSTDPTVTITGGGGSGATAVSNIVGSVVSITLTNGGMGYTVPPTISFGATFPFNTATATCTIAGGSVDTITLTSGGLGIYGPNPPVHFSGGGGTGAAATATISGGVAVVLVTNKGGGYTSTPTVVFSGGGGTGAAGRVVMGGKLCVQTPASDTYTVTVSATGYLDFHAGSFAITDDCQGATGTVTLILDATHSCVPDPCCPEEEQTGPPYVTPFFSWPATLHINDGIGTITLTKNPPTVGVSGVYSTCITRTADTATTDCTALVTDVDLPVPVSFRLVCASGVWTLTVKTPTSPHAGLTGTGFQDHYPDWLGSCGTDGFGDAVALNCAGSANGQVKTSTAVPTSCTTFAVSFPFTFEGNPSSSVYATLSQIYGSAPLTMPVSF